MCILYSSQDILWLPLLLHFSCFVLLFFSRFSFQSISIPTRKLFLVPNQFLVSYSQSIFFHDNTQIFLFLASCSQSIEKIDWQNQLLHMSYVCCSQSIVITQTNIWQKYQLVNAHITLGLDYCIVRYFYAGNTRWSLCQRGWRCFVGQG